MSNCHFGATGYAFAQSISHGILVKPGTGNARSGGHPLLRLATDYLTAQALCRIQDGFIDLHARYHKTPKMCDHPVIIAFRGDVHPEDRAFHRSHKERIDRTRVLLHTTMPTSSTTPIRPDGGRANFDVLCVDGIY